MAGSPEWKAFSADGEYRAAFKYPEDASFFIDVLGEGATLRHGHSKRNTVWTEGREEFPAGESADRFADTCHKRVQAVIDAHKAKIGTL